MSRHTTVNDRLSLPAVAVNTPRRTHDTLPDRSINGVLLMPHDSSGRSGKSSEALAIQ
jgi:hypothetical protein